MKKNLLFFLLVGLLAFSNAWAQTRKITGRVTSADDGQPLPGVSVRIQGTSQGVLTDGDGTFVLSASTGQVLSFSYIGFTAQSVTVPVGNFPPIRLRTDSRLLSEVVINDGYSKQSKKSYTGSATVVSGAENENKPFSTPLQSLQGEVAGLNVSIGSGQPGANVQVRLRGVGSISAGSNPIYVVDGMIINPGDLSRLTTTTNVLAGINQDDIENVTVLKDAAATAIYGSRGSNGVILITTKRGKAGKTVVRFDAEGGLTSNLPLPAAGKPLDGDQYRTLFLEGLTNAGQTPAQIAAATTSYGLNGPSNNWYDLVTRRGRQQQYNVSLSGGSENTRVFSSLGYFQQEATTIGSKLTRITGLLNIDHNISKRISITTNINASNVNQYTPSNGGGFVNPILAAYFLRPFQQPYNPDGSLNSSVSGNTNFNGIFNPLFMVYNDKRYTSQTRILGSETIKWNIWDALKFTSFTSVDYNLLEEQQYNNPIMGDGRTAGGRGYDYYSRYFNWLTRNQLDYRYNVKGVEDFYVDATVGYEAQRSQGYFISTNTNGYPLTQPLLTASAAAATPVLGNASFGNYTFDSFYARAVINYKNIYSLSGSYRRDGSSVFGTNNKFGSFYSVGGAWNIDGEDFFKSQKIFTTAKIRSSYGTTGNASGLGNYAALPTAGYGANYNGGNGQNFNTIGNPDLTWESQKKFDVGVTFGFFNDRLNFDIDYYRNNSDKLIQSVPVSRTNGFSSITGNFGGMLNKGVEIAVKGYPVRSKDFIWYTSFNVAFNHNKVTNLVNHAAYVNGSFHVVEGLDYYTYYTRLYAGVDPANGNALWYTDASKTATTANYTAAARVDYKQADPKAYGGFNNSFTYKGITLNADFYYNFGNMINDSWASYLMDGTSYTFNKYAYNMNRWTTPGQITDVPKYTAGGQQGGSTSNFSTRFLYYGDFIRLKNLSLGYDFKNINFLKQHGISKLYLYLRGTNVWTKTYDKRLPFDPEQGVTGISNLEVPQVRTFTLGLNVGF